METKCPLCGVVAKLKTRTINQTQTNEVTCPNCTNLSLQEGTEDILSLASQQSKDKFISMAEKMTGKQYLLFSINNAVKNLRGQPQLIATITDPSY